MGKATYGYFKVIFLKSTLSLTREAFMVLNSLRQAEYAKDPAYWSSQRDLHDVKA